MGLYMESKSVKAGDLLIRSGSNVDNIWYIGEGRVLATNGAIKISLKKGDFIGIVDFITGLHSFDYVAQENATIINFCTREVLMQTNFFYSKTENSRAIALSMNRIAKETYMQLDSLCSRGEKICSFVTDTITAYRNLCNEIHVDSRNFDIFNDIPEPVNMVYSQKSLFQYHKGLSLQLANRDTATELINNMFVPGYMLHTSNDIQEIVGAVEYASAIIEDSNNILINSNKEDLLECFNDLYITVGENHSLSGKIMDHMSDICSQAIEIPAEIKDARLLEMKNRSEMIKSVSAKESSGNVEALLYKSMDKILEFAQFDEEKSKTFKKLVAEFKNLADPGSLDDDAKRIRKEIESLFYMLYLSVMEASIEAIEEIPVLIKMFLNFGYLDEELAGLKNAVELYELAQTFAGKPSEGIYTGYEWLLAIFTRDVEPSINEFDQTYEQFISEMAENGRIPQKQLNLYLRDRGQMVMFELQNMFRHASKICSGRILNYCPIFCDYQILRSPKEDIVDARILKEAIDSVRNIDFSIFYRETVCVYSKKENIHDRIHVEVKPRFVLLPVVGSRGSMWQEIEGRDKLTAARMMLPVFDVDSLEKAILRMFAEYRWEMCKRIQGARWNDVTDPSLTSLYYDYLQFYRKNSEISTDQKEKIKLGLQKNRNSYKEYFISDYAEYIKYESTGSPHLVKASRAVLYAMCPFSAPIRNKLSSNPIFEEMNNKYKMKVAQNLHRLENISKKLISKNQPVPKELEREVAFYRL